jgi:hypothetical protein
MSSHAYPQETPTAHASLGQRPGTFWGGCVLALLLAIFAIAPLSYPGFFQARSGFLPTFNAAHLSSAPHWELPAGRADPIRGEGKVPYLLAWPFFRLSGSGVLAVKAGYALAFLLGALGTYAWARRWLGARSGVLAAIVYTYLPWHLGTVFVRGAYAEAWLWAFYPFLLWAVDRWAEGHVFPAAAVGVPAFAATLWSQPGLAVLGMPLLAAYGVAVAGRRRRLLVPLAAALALSLLLAWLAGRFAAEAPVPFADHFLVPLQLLSAAWGNGLSFQLGLAAVGLSIVAVALWLGGRPKGPEETEGVRETQGIPSAPLNSSNSQASIGRALKFWLAALAVLVLLTLPLSAFLWRITGLDALVTYPWQVLVLAGSPLAFLAGSAIRLDERLAVLPAWGGLVALTILASYPYLSPRFTQVDPGPEPVALFQPIGASRPQIMLLDYTVRASGEPAAITPTLALTLTWQAVEPVSDDYTVFLHLLAGGDVKAAQIDSRPCGGECPTNAWQPGEIVVDRYQLAMGPDAPPGPYRLAVGLYLLATGERAAVVGRDDGTVFLDVP